LTLIRSTSYKKALSTINNKIHQIKKELKHEEIQLNVDVRELIATTLREFNDFKSKSSSKKEINKKQQLNTGDGHIMLCDDNETHYLSMKQNILPNKNINENDGEKEKENENKNKKEKENNKIAHDKCKAEPIINIPVLNNDGHENHNHPLPSHSYCIRKRKREKMENETEVLPNPKKRIMDEMGLPKAIPSERTKQENSIEAIVNRDYLPLLNRSEDKYEPKTNEKNVNIVHTPTLSPTSSSPSTSSHLNVLPQAKKNNKTNRNKKNNNNNNNDDNDNNNICATPLTQTALKKLRVIDLRPKLKKRGLDTKGKKQSLISRLFQHLQTNENDQELIDNKGSDKAAVDLYARQSNNTNKRTRRRGRK